ncbi:hypothetical protein M900_1230 [Bacteriovorax sp. Seq25_V]|nr:hypothetical protein M900_1230 [Bacteriovorax sp. Seq25_V]
MAWSAYTYSADIKILSQGACWAQDESDTLKVSSFNEHSSYVVDKNFLGPLIQRLEKNSVTVSDITNIDSYIHCSGLGLRHVFKVSTANDQNFCVWGQYKKGELSILDFDLADSYQGICDGVVANKLIVGPANGFTIEDISSEVESYGYKVVAKSPLYKDISSITLEVESNEIFKIHTLLKASKTIRVVDLVTRQRPIGEAMFSEALSYSSK